MIEIESLKLPPGYTQEQLRDAIEVKLATRAYRRARPIRPLRWRITRESLDARSRGNIIWNIRLQVLEQHETFQPLSGVKVRPQTSAASKDSRVIIVGSGPAGYFAALLMARAGLRPLVIEQGSPVVERQKKVYEFWRGGRLDRYSNVQFGEGGAGTFSDGKLTTGVKSERKQEILEEFVLCGAPEEILYRSAPHIGTDTLSEVMPNFRRNIERLGGEVRFHTRLEDIVVKGGALRGAVVQNLTDQSTETLTCEQLVLATGHSARDTVRMLRQRGVAMTPKPFAVGLRIEHPQTLINSAQYRQTDDSFARQHLPPAAYKLSARLPNGRGVYTFCMCPGGFVVAATSSADKIVTNGMSRQARSSGKANSAVLVGVNPSDFGAETKALAGLEFQEELENQAFIAGGGDYFAPAQTVGDFLQDRLSAPEMLNGATYRPGARPYLLGSLFPRFVTASLKEGLVQFERKLTGFATPEAILTGVESRSSSPVRIVRDQRTLMSNVRGVYPAGEGAGYAGGIMSAAIDGLKVAERICSDLR